MSAVRLAQIPSSPSDGDPVVLDVSAPDAGLARAEEVRPGKNASSGGGSPGESLLPLWRYVAWALAFAVIASIWMVLRVQVRQLRLDIEHLEANRRELIADRDQLRMERDNRRRVLAMEAAAQSAPLVTAPRVHVPGDRP